MAQTKDGLEGKIHLERWMTWGTPMFFLKPPYWVRLKIGYTMLYPSNGSFNRDNYG
jgi:hypothetical protein